MAADLLERGIGLLAHIGVQLLQKLAMKNRSASRFGDGLNGTHGLDVSALGNGFTIISVHAVPDALDEKGIFTFDSRPHTRFDETARSFRKTAADDAQIGFKLQHGHAGRPATACDDRIPFPRRLPGKPQAHKIQSSET